MEITAVLHLKTHNQPKRNTAGLINLASKTFELGSKTELWPLSAMLYHMCAVTSEFYIETEAHTDEKVLEEFRVIIQAFQELADRYEKQLEENRYCLYCNQPLVTKDTGRKKVYCNDRCRQADHRKRKQTDMESD